MTAEIFVALLLFCLVSTVTPGPNNLMVMTSGANFGYRRTFPHMLGIALGFGLMVLLSGLGLMRLFDVVPWLRQLLLAACVAYLLWMAWKIAHAAPPEGRAGAAGQPMTFAQAAAFQWVNPKAWTMALSAITIYAPGHDLAAVAIVAGCFAAVCLPCLSLWVILGQQLRRLLSSPARLRAFNWTMAVLLVGSLYPLLLG